MQVVGEAEQLVEVVEELHSQALTGTHRHSQALTGTQEHSVALCVPVELSWAVDGRAALVSLLLILLEGRRVVLIVVREAGDHDDAFRVAEYAALYQARLDGRSCAPAGHRRHLGRHGDDDELPQLQQLDRRRIGRPRVRERDGAGGEQDGFRVLALLLLLGGHVEDV